MNTTKCIKAILWLSCIQQWNVCMGDTANVYGEVRNTTGQSGIPQKLY